MGMIENDVLSTVRATFLFPTVPFQATLPRIPIYAG